MEIRLGIGRFMMKMEIYEKLFYSETTIKIYHKDDVKTNVSYAMFEGRSVRNYFKKNKITNVPFS